MPERWTEDASQAILKDRAPMGVAMTDYELELVRAYTMLGDVVADAYAALMPKVPFRRLIDMLQEACARGVENVAGAPPELVAFIRDMERIPDWVDMDMVREGARLDLNVTANISPFAIRGAFIATFLNTSLERFEKRFSRRPQGNTVVTLSYDSTRVFAEAVRRAPTLTGPGIKAALERIRFVPSVTAGPRTHISGGPYPQHAVRSRGVEGRLAALSQSRRRQDDLRRLL
jgi:hypothetical protein